MQYIPPAEYPIDIDFPDIDPYRAGNSGIDWITCFDSGQAGPHVMVSAIVHGNEPCGAIALDWLFCENIRPIKGKLSLGFMNVSAYQAFDPDNPNASRFLDEDFNRLWDFLTLEGPRRSRELARAREVRPWIETVDFLLDLHSMQEQQPPLMLAGPHEKGRVLARKVGMPTHIVSDAGHAAGRRMRDFSGLGDPKVQKNALLYEAGQHWEVASGPRSIDVTLRFLHALGMIDPNVGTDFLEQYPRPDEQHVVEITDPVTVKSDNFTFAQDFRGMDVLKHAGTLIGHDGDQAIVTPYDDCILIMPSRRLWRGQTAVRLGKVMF